MIRLEVKEYLNDKKKEKKWKELMNEYVMGPYL